MPFVRAPTTAASSAARCGERRSIPAISVARSFVGSSAKAKRRGARSAHFERSRIPKSACVSVTSEARYAPTTSRPGVGSSLIAISKISRAVSEAHCRSSTTNTTGRNPEAMMRNSETVICASFAAESSASEVGFAAAPRRAPNSGTREIATSRRSPSAATIFSRSGAMASSGSASKSASRSRNARLTALPSPSRRYWSNFPVTNKPPSALAIVRNSSMSAVFPTPGAPATSNAFFSPVIASSKAARSSASSRSRPTSRDGGINRNGKSRSPSGKDASDPLARRSMSRPTSIANPCAL